MPELTPIRKEIIQRLLASAEQSLAASSPPALKACGKYRKADFSRLMTGEVPSAEWNAFEEHIIACPSCQEGLHQFSESERDRIENEALFQVACRVLDRVLPEPVPGMANIVLRYLQGTVELVAATMQLVPLQPILAVRGEEESTQSAPHLIFRQEVLGSPLSVEASFLPNQEKNGIVLSLSLYDLDLDTFVSNMQVEVSGPMGTVGQETDLSGLASFTLDAPGSYETRFFTATDQVPLLVIRIEIRPSPPVGSSPKKFHSTPP